MNRTHRSPAIRGASPAIVFLGLLLAAMLPAREFRTLRPVLRPERPKLAKGAEWVPNPRPVPVRSVREAVRQLAGSWNTPRMGQVLDDRFYDRDRLLDSVDQKVPRDARLRVLDVRNARTLWQYREKGPKPGVERYTSRVAAQVHTITEYNEPGKGYTRLDGVNEYILEITEEVQR